MIRTKRHKRALCAAMLPLFATQTLCTSQSRAQTPVQTAIETQTQRDARMKWFRDARFGLFIHWGVYSVPAGEHNGKTNYGEWFLEETKMPVSQYEKFAQGFNADKFNADYWVKLAKDAGMKYIVITSKHHDGFAIYPSKLNDWNSARTPFKRDAIMELAKACQKAGLKLCFYHSIMDWRHPDYTPRRAHNDFAPTVKPTPEFDQYVAFMKGQLNELLTRYGPIGILWFDGEWEESWNNARGRDLYNYVRALQPNIIINNRVGKGRSGMQGMNNGEGVGDYGTPEQEIPATGFGPNVDWESCMTMNNHWGFNAADQNWKSSEILVRNLIDCASKGGNYLLNVGPTAQGEIPAPSIQRLQQIGDWMKVNREAIYSTTASPFKRLTWGRATTKRQGNDTTLYLHVWNWPTDGQLRVPGLKNSILSAQLLGAKPQKLSALNFEDGVRVQLSRSNPAAFSTTIALKFKGAPQVEDEALAQASDGTLQLLPLDATAHGELKIEQASDGRDNFGFWLNSNDWLEWSFRAVRPGRYQVVAEIAASQASSFDVLLGEQKVRANSVATKDFKTFQTMPLGEVKIEAAGEMKLQIKPDAANWKPINLRSVTLRLLP